MQQFCPTNFRLVVVVVGAVVGIVVRVEVGVDAELDLAQHASRIPATIKKLKPNQIPLALTIYLHFY